MTPKRFFFVLTGILGLLVVGGSVAYYLASTNLHAGTMELSQRLADEQLADDKLNRLTDLQKQFNRLQPVLNQLDAALPKTKNQSELAIQLQNLAQQSGMSIDAVTFQTDTALPTAISQTVKTGGVLAIPVNFSLVGTYPQLQAFLQRQEHLNRYTNVTNLTISRNADGRVAFAITLNAYVKP